MSEAFDGIGDLFRSTAHSDPQSGVLTLADLDNMIDTIKEQASTADHWAFYLSPRMAARVRWLMRHMELIGKMYRAYPPPRYKIRKCHMRKLQARWRKCMRRFHKIEQSEGLSRSGL